MIKSFHDRRTEKIFAGFRTSDFSMETARMALRKLKMLHNASSDPQIITGALHGSIRTHNVRKSRSGGKYITIGVKHSEKGAYYANPVEHGHGGPAPAPAHPFVRPAFDVRKDEAYQIMKKILKDELLK